MKELPNTSSNKKAIQDFIDETKKRITDGVSITFTKKAQDELSELDIESDITTTDIESAILNLTVENYYRGVDPSRKADFNVCAFYSEIGVDNIGIYLKYGIEINGLQILIFSNHTPDYPMNQPFLN